MWGPEIQAEWIATLAMHQILCTSLCHANSIYNVQLTTDILGKLNTNKARLQQQALVYICHILL